MITKYISPSRVMVDGRLNADIACVKIEECEEFNPSLEGTDNGYITIVHNTEVTEDKSDIRQPLSIVLVYCLHLASGSAAGAGRWGHSLKEQSVRKNTFLQLW